VCLVKHKRQEHLDCVHFLCCEERKSRSLRTASVPWYAMDSPSSDRPTCLYIDGVHAAQAGTMAESKPEISLEVPSAATSHTFRHQIIDRHTRHNQGASARTAICEWPVKEL